MQIDKQLILDLLAHRGEHDKVKQADSDLPSQVDTVEHAKLLTSLGVYPADLIGGAGGAIAGRLRSLR